MPKLIEDLRETILTEGKTMLLENGLEKLTIRNVAAACHVAVGTIYNYFPSKEILVASIMLEDWLKALARMKAAAEDAQTAIAALQGMFDAIAGFCLLYRQSWAQSGESSSSMPYLYERHRQLVTQLNAVTEWILERFEVENGAQYSRFITEVLLQQATQADVLPFDDLLPVLTKLLT